MGILAVVYTKVLMPHILFPAMHTASVGHTVFSWSFVAVALIIECFCLYYVVRDPIRVLLTAVVMNAASTFVGIFLFLSANRFFLRIVQPLIALPYLHNTALMHLSPSELLSYLFFGCGLMVINLLVEYPIARMLLPAVARKKLIFIIILANALSIIIGLIGARMYGTFTMVI
jgi:hypothetical protein